MVTQEQVDRVLNNWLGIPHKRFCRHALVTDNELACDCSGLINLLGNHFQIKSPFNVERPKALHFFALLQEIGSNKSALLKPGNILAWRKDTTPKSGDTGHVLMLASYPTEGIEGMICVDVYDATKQEHGLAKRKVQFQVDELGTLIGVRLHATDSKIKRTAIYHAPFVGTRDCFGCALPTRMCACGHVEPSKHSPSIVILRHPDERGRTLSTVSLIKQRFPSVLVKEGERFEPLRAKQLALVFPNDDSQRVSAGQNRTEQYDAETTLILIDATWKKAKKILHLNPWLNDLPKVSIRPDKLSSYKIRKVPDAKALSTVEAFAEVSNSPELNHLFDAFVSKQIETMGREVYERNYRHYLNFE